MTPPVLQAMQRLIARLRRRLFLLNLLRFLLVGWAGAFLLAACWILLQPYLSGEVDRACRWVGTGSLFLAGSGLAALFAIRTTPNSERAALALDERLGLEERITTALCLTEEQRKSAVGQALLQDVEQRLPSLKVRESFPLKLSWQALLAPVLTASLALLAFFHEPPPSNLRAGNDDKELIPAAQVQEIEKKINDLKKTLTDLPKDRLTPEKRKELEAAWDKLLKNPLDIKDRDKLRDYVHSVRSLEDQIEVRLEELKSLDIKNRALKAQLGKLTDQEAQHPAHRLSDPEVKAVQDALAKGNFAKAAEQVDRLSKKLKDGQKNDKRARELQDEMDQLKIQLQRLADQQEARDRLQREREQGLLDQEQLQRELGHLEQLAEELKDLKQMGMTLEEFQKLMKEGKLEKASMKLEDLAKLLKELKENGEALKKMGENHQILEEARLLMLQGLNRDQNDGNPKQDLAHGGGREGAVGRRPQGAEQQTKSLDAREKGQSDLQGKTRLLGLGRGGTFNKIPSKEVSGAFEQARQQAPEVIERQRIPEEAAEFAKGYFENLGGQNKRKK